MRRHAPRFLPLIAAAATGLGLAGCRSFEADWAGVRAGSMAPDPRGLAGAWAGTWSNTNNTHAGALRAVLWRVDDDEYRARFHATWGRHSGSFRTRLRGTWTNGAFEFSGSRRILGIPIRTSGRADASRLESGYDSPLDRGTFLLGRPRAD